MIGTGFPSAEGLAGFVLRSREPLVIEDVEQDPRFARDVAEQTGYVPKGLMAAPLLRGEQALGVLSVLDREEGARTTLADMDLLGLFASQAAIALDLLRGARRAKAVVEGGAVDVAIVAELAAALEAADEEQREAGLRLLRASLVEVLGRI